MHCCKNSVAGLLSLIANVSASRLLQSTRRSVDVRLLRVCGSCSLLIQLLSPVILGRSKSELTHLDNDTVPSSNGGADWRKHRVQQGMRAWYDVNNARALASAKAVVS